MTDFTDVQRLAKQGDKDELYEMAWRSELVLPDGKNSPTPDLIAWRAYWMKKAGEKGNNSAKMIYAGMLIDMPLSKDGRREAMSLFESLVSDFKANKLPENDRGVGIDAKVELGILLCEGNGTDRDYERGVKLIKSAENDMKSFGGFRFTHLFKLGELFGLGYAQEYEEPLSDDLKQAIEYLERARVSFNSDRDNPDMLTQVEKYLEHFQNKQLPNKESLEKQIAGLPIELKSVREKKQKEYNIKAAKERRDRLKQLAESEMYMEYMKRIEDAMLRLHQRLAREDRGFSL